MRAIDAYRGLRKELDKTASPSFSISDFNYFINTAILDYIAENYSSIDLRQKEDDDLSEVINFDVELTGLSGWTVDLPANYRHTLGVRVMLKFLSDKDGYKKDNIITVNEVIRLRTGARGAENAYKLPSYRKVFYQIAKKKMHISAGSIVMLQKVYLDYINIGASMYLNPDNTVDYSLEVNNSTLPFTEDVCFEIVRRCALTLLENMQNPRYGSALQEKRLRQE